MCWFALTAAWIEDATSARSDSLSMSLQVIRLLGVCTQGEELMMILELASRGDLRHFLLDCRPTQDTEALLTATHLVKMGLDVTSGMQFLASNGLVHRDLACRYECSGLACWEVQQSPH